MNPAIAPPLVEVDGLQHIYPNGARALQGVTLSIGDGEIVGLIGQNGSGKTTLVKHFNGLLRPTFGRVVVAGQDTRKVPVSRLARQVGYVFQNPDHQIFSNTVRDEVAFGPRNVGLDRAAVAANVEAALRTMDLVEFVDWHPMRLSRGRRQRLAIAAVMAMQPRLLVLDEPTGGMDREQVRRLRAVLDELHAAGRTIVIVTHDLEIVAEVCSRAIVLLEGRVLLDGAPREVFRHEDELRHTFIRPPQIARLSLALGFPRVALSVDEAAEELCRRAPSPVAAAT